MTHAHHHDSTELDLFGFWLYILSDCVLFATLFAVFSVFNSNMYGGYELKDMTNIPYTFVETMALLLSSFTCGLAVMASYKNNLRKVLTWLMVTFSFGLTFLGMEIYEFMQLYAEGRSWRVNASLSSFFTLVGTHGVHVLIGLLWIVVLLMQFGKFNVNALTKKRLTYFALFWAFLDVIWIFVFTDVYLMGAL